MQNLILKKFKIILITFFLFFSFETLSLENVVVIGNKNISKITIESFAPQNIDTLNSDIINTYQKKLYETGFFENVTIQIKNNKLFITVIENPMVNFFYLDGINNESIKNKIFDIIKIKENTIFQNYTLSNDVKNINNYLNNIGYINNKVETQIIKIKDNKLNIFYNINLNEKFKINRIYFIGDKHFKSSTLKNIIFLSEHGWWKFFSNTTTPSESLINFDISKLKNFYLNNGFYDVQINSNSVRILNNSKVDLTYSINSGRKFYIDQVNLKDNSKVLKKENINFLNKKFEIIKYKIYNKFLINDLTKIISKYLSDSNFDLNLNYSIQKSIDNKLIINYFVDEPSDKKIINKIVIGGNTITDDFVIRNNLFFSEGDLFNKNKLAESIKKIEGNGLFDKINYEILNIDNNNVQLNINVIEKPTGEIAAGAGGGTNGLAITGSLNERNFLGKGIFVNSSVNLGTQKSVGRINISTPDYKNSGNTLNSSFFVENNNFDNTSYENKVIGSSISIYYEIFDKIFLEPGFAFDLDSLNANSDASYLVKKREGDFFTTKVFYNFSKNTKNREFQATEGYVFGAGQDLSIWSDIPYLKNRIFGSYYNEYLDNFIGSIRYKAETINSFENDIKYSDRLFVSNNYLRGFSHKGIGPKVDNDFIGGNYSFYSSFSSTVPNGLPEKWNALTNVFFDVANVWGVDDNSTDDSNKIRSSVGIGFSWISPVGPISFTYAQPISKANTDDVENFSFNIGSAF